MGWYDDMKEWLRRYFLILDIKHKFILDTKHNFILNFENDSILDAEHNLKHLAKMEALAREKKKTTERELGKLMIREKMKK